MSGYMRVVIREKDGRVWSNRRWASASPVFTRDVRFVDDDDAWFELFRSKSHHHTEDHALAPIDYGILVVDRMTMTVIDHNEYGSVLDMSVMDLYNTPEDEQYLDLLARGLLLVDGEPLVVPEGRTLREHALALYERPNGGRVAISSPWTYVKLRGEPYEEVRRRMKELGFAFSPRDEAAFDAFVASGEDEPEEIAEIMAGIPKTEADAERDTYSTMPTPPAPPPERTYVVDVWEDESIWTWEGPAATTEEAEAAAVGQLNQDWERDYATMDQMRQDVDGVAVMQYEAIMADREPLARFEAKKELATLVEALLDQGSLIDVAGEPRERLRALVEAARA